MDHQQLKQQKADTKGKQNRKVFFKTFGCRSNYADTIELQAGCLENGATPTDTLEDSDVLVINSCTVTDNADKEVLKTIQKLKKINSSAKVIVTGCMAEASDNFLSAIEDVDSIVGTGRKDQVISEIINSSSHKKEFTAKNEDAGKIRSRTLAKKKKSINLENSFSDYIPGPNTAIGEAKNRSRYYLRIQEGCENSCTFCIIPFTRGGLSSRSIDNLIHDIERIAKLGYKEVVLTGTHIGGYGEDLGIDFYTLLSKLDQHSHGMRFRLSSIDPNDLSPKIIDLISDSDVFCNHLHVCMQAFDDKVLKLMNRRYNLSQAMEVVDYIQNLPKQLCLGSDVIVGFNGESREIFESSLRLFEENRFDYMHVFPFSERAGTPATLMKEVVDQKERKLRSKRWRAVADRKKRDFYKRNIGKVLSVVVEGESNGSYGGTSSEFLSVQLPKDVFGELSPGSLVEVVSDRFNEKNYRLECKPK